MLPYEILHMRQKIQQSRDSEMQARIGVAAKQMDSFNFFFGVELGRKILNMADNLLSKRQELGIDAPQLPRRRKVPRKLEVGTSTPETEKSVEDLNRMTNYEVIDFVLHAICSRFDQKWYRILARLESLLCDTEVI